MRLKLEEYMQFLKEMERSKQTRKQYQRDIGKFIDEMKWSTVTKETVIGYKKDMQKKYQPSSVNTKIAALNGFFDYIGRKDLRIRQIRIQKRAYCPQEQELSKREYQMLVNTARTKGNEKLAMMIQTICGTGIRVSELQYITAEAVAYGEAVVRLKGKTRIILIAGKLKKLLTTYIRKRRIRTGPIFVTRNQRPVDRSNIWKMMKALCAKAGVDAKKVFPHNLRHLFAKCFYEMDKDIAKLADILGHTNINTTRIYIITSSGEHSRKIDKFGLVI